MGARSGGARRTFRREDEETGRSRSQMQAPPLRGLLAPTACAGPLRQAQARYHEGFFGSHWTTMRHARASSVPSDQHSTSGQPRRIGARHAANSSLARVRVRPVVARMPGRERLPAHQSAACYKAGQAGPEGIDAPAPQACRSALDGRRPRHAVCRTPQALRNMGRPDARWHSSVVAESRKLPAA